MSANVHKYHSSFHRKWISTCSSLKWMTPIRIYCLRRREKKGPTSGGDKPFDESWNTNNDSKFVDNHIKNGFQLEIHPKRRKTTRSGRHLWLFCFKLIQMRLMPVQSNNAFMTESTIAKRSTMNWSGFVCERGLFRRISIDLVWNTHNATMADSEANPVDSKELTPAWQNFSSSNMNTRGEGDTLKFLDHSLESIRSPSLWTHPNSHHPYSHSVAYTENEWEINECTGRFQHFIISICLGIDKMSSHKSTVDVQSMSTNNVYVGATSGQWNAEGRERGNTIRWATFNVSFLLATSISPFHRPIHSAGKRHSTHIRSNIM